MGSLRNIATSIILNGGFHCFFMLLAINTCLRRVEVALIDEESRRVLYEKSEISERDHAEKIFGFLKEALGKKSARGSKSQMLKPDKILVVTGPGAFTSVRVGVVTANTMVFSIRAHGNAAELCSIDLKTLFDYEGKKLPLYLSAGKSEIYKIESYEKFVKNDAKKFFKNIMKEFYGDLNEYHLSLMKNPKLLLNRKLSFGTAILKLVKSGKLESRKIKPDSNGITQALPTYLKEPNISISKKQL